ncbi:MAG TPA: hypothetical protein VGS23_02415 [Thermoplasmata archaeon]|nr:hypothetical protein [Thermoplasmata archaeon]
MNRAHVKAFSGILKRQGIRFVIVGGAAVAQVYPSETRDVDVLLLAHEYRKGVDVLDHDPSIASMTREDNEMSGGHFVVGHALIRFDILNPEAFSGSRSGDEFFEYVLRSGSRKTAEGPVAKVAVVWYMRLVLEGDAWLVQVQKIMRDLRAGAPWSLQKEVRRIAKRFGMLARLEDRLVLVKQEAERAGLLRTD